jgi:hypothetical protein
MEVRRPNLEGVLYGEAGSLQPSWEWGEGGAAAFYMTFVRREKEIGYKASVSNQGQ